ncbi:MAG TPA: hypothetical protein P5299_00705 [Candidatus Woesebacteria bacterium]|nr:hypothetical protein [Candidatus Woesebacteria bacterium]HRT39869.1 hypothetical protein [Candidatus Woesebacteria bacterium]
MIIDLDKLSHLANLPINNPTEIIDDLNKITVQFNVLDKIDTDQIESTFQVNGLKNITRPDKVQSTSPIHQGFFVTSSLKNQNER